MPANVREIARLHPHAAPHSAIGERAAEALTATVADEVAESAVVVIEVTRLALQQPVKIGWIAIRPVG
jgi:formylmethanofuran dehydrogenase subunit E